MKARNIIFTMAAIVALASPTAMLAQAGPGSCDGTGPHGGSDGGYGRQGGGQGWFGHGDRGNQLHFFERVLPRLAEELDLSEQQLEEIEAIVDSARPEIERLAGLVRDGREAYRSENSDPTVFDEGAFRAHANAQHALQIELMVAAEKTRADVFKVLTPEQIEQLGEMRAAFGKRSFRRGGGRRPIT